MTIVSSEGVVISPIVGGGLGLSGGGVTYDVTINLDTVQHTFTEGLGGGSVNS